LFRKLQGQGLHNAVVARLHEQLTSAGTPVVLGFARSREGTGGVRRHLECLHHHCQTGITLLPDAELCEAADRCDGWKPLMRAVRSMDLSRFPIVHSHVNPKFIDACRAARQRGSRWVHTYHTFYFESDWPGGLQPWQQAINSALLNEARHADVRISISRWLHDLMLDQHGIDSEIIPNGVDAEACSRVEPSRRTDLPANFLLFSGSSRSVKNPELFVRLAAARPDAGFVMIGQGLAAGEFRPADGTPLPQNLTLLGPQTHADALSLVRRASALVVTSYSEGLPTAVLEAMAMGTTVVVPDSHGCRDLVTHGRTGFKFAPGSLEELCRALDASQSAEASVKEAAQRMINDDFAWPAVARKIDAVYARLMNHA
jgi:glycosyltransferase involved in cell wall biosynthesis